MKSDASARRLVWAVQGVALLWASVAALTPLRAAAQAPAQAAQAPAQVPELPVEYFTNALDVGEMKISPDGKYIAFTTGEDGNKFLVFVSLDERKVTASIQAEADVRIYDFHWVSPTRAIYMYTKRLPGRFAYGGGVVRAVNRDGSQHDVIYSYSGEKSTGQLVRARASNPATADFVSALRRDDRYILITETPWQLRNDTWYSDPDAHPRITRLNVYDGSEFNMGVVPLIRPQVLVDNQDRPRFAFGYNEEHKSAVVWKENVDAEWTSFAFPGFHEDTIRPRRFTRDDRGVYFTAVRDGERFSALYRLDLASRAVERVAEIPDGPILSVVPDLKDEEIAGVAGYNGKMIFQWITPQDPAATLLNSLSRSFAGHEVRLLNSSEDGRRALLFVRSDRSPGEYFLFDTQTKRADMLRAARRGIDPGQMRPRESVTITARDGMRLRGFVTKPASPGPHPLIVMPHDGPHNVFDTSWFDSDSQLLANRGYAVVQVNYRGSGGSGPEHEAAGYQKWGTAIQDDIADATRWAIEQKIADPNRVCIVGEGFGGYSALMNSIREPKLYRCAIATAGMFDLPDWLERGGADSVRSYLARTMGSDVAMLRAQSPMYQADRIEASVLLIQRKYSQQAYADHSKEMYAKLQEAKKNVQIFEPVGVQDAEMRRMIFERMLAFLEVNLKSP